MSSSSSKNHMLNNSNKIPILNHRPGPGQATMLKQPGNRLERAWNRHKGTTPIQPNVSIFLRYSPDSTLHSQLWSRKINSCTSNTKTQPWDKVQGCSPISLTKSCGSPKSGWRGGRESSLIHGIGAQTSLQRPVSQMIQTGSPGVSLTSSTKHRQPAMPK